MRRYANKTLRVQMHLGWRSKDDELCAIAQKYGFQINRIAKHDQQNELNRSTTVTLLKKLIPKLSIRGGVQSSYIRYFEFQKTPTPVKCANSVDKIPGTVT
jgi:hypothetical protein